MLRGTHSLDKRGLKSKKRLGKRLATAVLQLLQLVPISLRHFSRICKGVCLGGQMTCSSGEVQHG
jgi:hypothetical protein